MVCYHITTNICSSNEDTTYGLISLYKININMYLNYDILAHNNQYM